MEKSSKLKIVGLTLAGLSVLASGSALAASLKVGGQVRTDFVMFNDDVDHPQHGLGYGAGNLSFDNGSNVTGANIYLRGTLMDRWVYNLSVSHNFRAGRSEDSTNSTEGLATGRKNGGDPRRGGPFVLDAWVGWDKFDPYARFSMGRMNSYQGLENTGNRSAYTFIAPAAGQSSFAKGRVDGIAVEGNPFKWWGYQAGLYFHTTNASQAGAAPGTGSDIDTRSQVVVSNAGNHLSMFSGRTFLQPLVQPGKVLHIGGTYQKVDTDGDVSLNAAPGGYFNNSNAQMLRLSSAVGPAVTRDAVTGSGNGVNRTDGYTLWGLEGLAVWGPFHLQAEYTDYSLDLANLAKLAGNAKQTMKNNQAAGAASRTSSIDASGWYAQGSWMLTGESRNYDPVSGTLGKVNPRNAKWGAWEVAFRWDQVNFDDNVNVTGVSNTIAATTNGTATTWCGDKASSATQGAASGCTNGGNMTDWTVGLNWYPNNNVKLMFNYTNASADFAKENVTAANAGSGPNFAAASGKVVRSATRDVDVWALTGQVDF